jgi:hypothetical protein
MPINKTEMPKVGQYVYITKKKTELPILAKVKRVHSLCWVQCITKEGVVDVSRCDFALTKEEAIQKVTTALDKRIIAAQQRIKESQALKKALTQVSELPPTDAPLVSTYRARSHKSKKNENKILILANCLLKYEQS